MRLSVPFAFALGAAAMYLFDPQQGTRRRAILRDQARARSTELREWSANTARDLDHRTRGLQARLRGLFERRPVTDEHPEKAPALQG